MIDLTINYLIHHCSAQFLFLYLTHEHEASPFCLLVCFNILICFLFLVAPSCPVTVMRCSAGSQMFHPDQTHTGHDITVLYCCAELHFILSFFPLINLKEPHNSTVIMCQSRREMSLSKTWTTLSKTYIFSYPSNVTF